MVAKRFFVAAGMLLGLGLVVACAQSTPANEGGDCFAATDCASGLICAVGKDGRRACTNDLTDTTKVPGSTGGGKDASALDAAKSDAATTPDAQTPVQDATIDAFVVVPEAGTDATANDAAGD